MINTALVSKDAERDDCTVVKVNALELAAKAGTDRESNFVMLGAYVGATDIVPLDAVEDEIKEEFAGRKAKFIPANLAAFHAGVEAGKAANPVVA